METNPSRYSVLTRTMKKGLHPMPSTQTEPTALDAAIRSVLDSFFNALVQVTNPSLSGYAREAFMEPMTEKLMQTFEEWHARRIHSSGITTTPSLPVSVSLVLDGSMIEALLRINAVDSVSDILEVISSFRSGIAESLPDTSEELIRNIGMGTDQSTLTHEDRERYWSAQPRMPGY